MLTLLLLLDAKNLTVKVQRGLLLRSDKSRVKAPFVSVLLIVSDQTLKNLPRTGDPLVSVLLRTSAPRTSLKVVQENNYNYF